MWIFEKEYYKEIIRKLEFELECRKERKWLLYTFACYVFSNHSFSNFIISLVLTVEIR